MISTIALSVCDPASHSPTTLKDDFSMSPTPENVPPKTVVLLAPTAYVAQFGMPS